MDNGGQLLAQTSMKMQKTYMVIEGPYQLYLPSSSKMLYTTTMY